MILWRRNIFRSTNNFGYENLMFTIMFVYVDVKRGLVAGWHLPDKYLVMRIVEKLIDTKCWNVGSYDNVGIVG